MPDQYPIVEYLRGWRIYNYRDTLRGRDVWVATRHGVRMNTNTYDGIVRMILQRETT